MSGAHMGGGHFSGATHSGFSGSAHRSNSFANGRGNRFSNCFGAFCGHPGLDSSSWGGGNYNVRRPGNQFSNCFGAFCGHPGLDSSSWGGGNYNVRRRGNQFSNCFGAFCGHDNFTSRWGRNRGGGAGDGDGATTTHGCGVRGTTMITGSIATTTRARHGRAVERTTIWQNLACRTKRKRTAMNIRTPVIRIPATLSLQTRINKPQRLRPRC